MKYHTPVLLKETLEYLSPKKDGFYIDATGGGGGHSKEILKLIIPEGKLIFIDRDEQAIKEAEQSLKDFEGYVIFVNDNFSNIDKILSEMNISNVNGILFDLGVSSHQIDTGQRGFSYMQDGPLDMRMDPSSNKSAKEVVNNYCEDELVKIMSEFGEERFAKRISRNIVRSRPLSSTKELADIIKRSVPQKYSFDSVVRVFQAIRIEVNDEMESLSTALSSSIKILNKGGRIVVISYHSLEDRIVKNIFREAASTCICDKKLPVCVCKHERTLDIITRKPVTASPDETADNSRARSAKLRAAEKV